MHRQCRGPLIASMGNKTNNSRNYFKKDMQTTTKIFSPLLLLVLASMHTSA
jgi:hypothetical protein